MPENLWDAKAGLKLDALKGEFEAKNELAAFKAAEDSKRLALPQKPEEYKIALPESFKPPEGIKFEIDEKSDVAISAREWAHRHGVRQEAFSELLGLYGGLLVGDEQQKQTARRAQIEQLGQAGTARVTAIETFLDAKGYSPLKAMLVTADIVKAMEGLVAKASGADNFSQRHRDNDVPGKLSDDEYKALSFSEKRAYAEKHPQPAQQMNGR